MFENYLVEFFGTLLFVFVFVATQNTIAIGATLAFILLMASKSSGGYNPAVTIALASCGKMPIKDVLPHCLSQVLGGLSAIQIFKRFKL
jgi:glycerol uptake facilitator-like aquaporin